MKLTIGNYTIDGTAQEVYELMRMEQDNAAQEEVTAPRPAAKERTRIGKPCVIRDNNGNGYIMKSRSDAARWLHGRGLFVSEVTIGQHLRENTEYRIGRYTVVENDGSTPVSA